MATLATCSRCSSMWSSIVRPRSAAAHPRGASRGPRPLHAQPAPSAAGSRPGDRELGAGQAGADKGEARQAARGRGRRARAASWRSSSARRPARRAAGVRCNKQLATQTPARWACAAAAGRAGACSRAARAPATADVRGWAAALGARPMRLGKMLERGSPQAHGEAEGRNGGLSSQPEPECKLCPSELGTRRFWAQSESPTELARWRRPESGRGEIWRNR